MNFTTDRNGARRALMVSGISLKLAARSQEGQVALGIRSAPLRVDLDLTPDEALAMAAELMAMAAHIGPDATLNLGLPEVLDSNFGEFAEASRRQQ